MPSSIGWDIWVMPSSYSKSYFSVVVVMWVVTSHKQVIFFSVQPQFLQPLLMLVPCSILWLHLHGHCSWRWCILLSHCIFCLCGLLALVWALNYGHCMALVLRDSNCIQNDVISQCFSLSLGLEKTYTTERQSRFNVCKSLVAASATSLDGYLPKS